MATPTTEGGIATIPLDESYKNYLFMAIQYGFGWGWVSWVVVPCIENLGIINITADGGIGVSYARIDKLTDTSLKVTAFNLLGQADPIVDYITVYGVIKK